MCMYVQDFFNHQPIDRWNILDKTISRNHKQYAYLYILILRLDIENDNDNKDFQIRYTRLKIKGFERNHHIFKSIYIFNIYKISKAPYQHIETIEKRPWI